MFEFVVVVLCLLLNALLSCIEMAFVTVSKPRLKKLAEEGNRHALKVLNLKTRPERVLSVLQVGITLVGAISAAVGGASAEEFLSPIYEEKFHFSEEVAEGFAIVTVVVPLTFFSVVLGELVPKTLALRFPVKTVLLGTFLMRPMEKFFSPFVWILEASTKLIINLVISRIGSESIISGEEGINIDDLSDTHKQYVMNLIGVDKRRVRDILLPWSSVITVDKNEHYLKVLDLLKTSRHTRIPVVDQGQPIGILHSKEFIAESEVVRMNWLEIMRPVIFIHWNEPILNALRTLQANKSHMAVIRKGDTAIGVVTLEDIFEEVVGEIYDEDDSPRTLLSSNAKIRSLNVPKPE